MTRHLIKYVVIADISNVWVSMHDALHDARRESRCIKTPTRVEKWTYPVEDDGTHGIPTKEVM